jgi:hypothetical protein
MDGTVTDTIASGETPVERARAERRGMRLLSLAAARDLTVEMMERLNDGAAGRLHYEEQARFDDRVRDPYLSASRLSQELCRIVMLEERLDEDAETREKRLAEEQAERERKARAREAARREDAETAAIQDKKRTVRDAVGRIYLNVNPETTEMDLNRLLDGLLDEYELDLDDDMDRAYADTTAAVVRLCEELEIETELSEDEADDETPEAARTRLVELARTYIDMVCEAGAANANLAEEPVRALAQGPPG